MIKILLCCLGGFSSSAIAERMKKDIINKNMSEQCSLEFQPFSLADRIKDDFDIIVCCPHLRMNVKKYLNQKECDKPIYILPPRMYGNMQIEEIYQDCLDLIEMFKETKQNPIHFPNEENILRVTRMCAYNKTR